MANNESLMHVFNVWLQTPLPPQSATPHPPCILHARDRFDSYLYTLPPPSFSSLSKK